MARKRKPQPEVKAEPRRVTPADIQQKEFRLAFRGYNERDVDVFLDQVTEEVARLHAENKRFRDELEMRSTVRGDTGAAVQADALIRQARDEAARIMAEARAVAARLAVSAATAPAPATPTAPLGSEAAPSPGSRAALGRVVSRERDFLQTLAGLIQDHARALKEDLSSMRSASSAGARRDEAAPRDDAEPRAECKAEGTPAETAADSQPASPEHLTPQPVVRRPLPAEPATPEPATPEPATPEPPVAGGQIMEEPTATDGPAGEGERGDSTQAWESFFDAAAEAPSAEAEETVIHPEE